MVVDLFAGGGKVIVDLFAGVSNMIGRGVLRDPPVRREQVGLLALRCARLPAIERKGNSVALTVDLIFGRLAGGFLTICGFTPGSVGPRLGFGLAA
ncbi:hypothetical protein FACS189497_09330 [Betaproteobacteria bacterium]|nr:hypothetical protein AGMMS50243_05170 [Betaproteobacteria bacterium]GHU30107.1 hypothetical protein FACS189497_09330 [Betaproteobacteria bacterium]